MLHLASGQFFGRTTETTRLDGLTLTDTEYIHDRVDWHYHERPYFTFLLQGGLIEGTKKAVHQCVPGSLLFHNWQEPHYNLKPRGISRGFHVEIDHSWLQEFDLDPGDLQGDLRIQDPHIKILFHKIFLESKQAGPEQSLAIQSLLLQVLSRLHKIPERCIGTTPVWVKRLQVHLPDLCTEPLSLTQLSQVAGVHPIHLSRAFPKYFHSSLGAYLRNLKVDRALSLMCNCDHSLSGIAHIAGFADQSHFIRCFREVMGMSPSEYRRGLASGKA